MKTWNPIGGRCEHKCTYCWAQAEGGLVDKYKMGKYRGEPTLIAKELFRVFKPGETVFVQDMSDLFAKNVKPHIIEGVLKHLAKFPETTFLLLTKNPARYYSFINYLTPNMICGATIETNRQNPDISNAPPPIYRFDSMRDLKWKNKFISIEPVLDFDLDVFLKWLKVIAPQTIHIGYDNYNHRMGEPILAKVESLISKLKIFIPNVEVKSMRTAWYESTDEKDREAIKKQLQVLGYL